MSKHGTGVTGYTHTRNQLDHYANQCNPNHAEYAKNSGGKKNGI